MLKVSTGRFFSFPFPFVMIETAVSKCFFASPLGIPVTCHSESCCIIFGQVVKACNLISGRTQRFRVVQCCLFPLDVVPKTEQVPELEYANRSEPVCAGKVKSPLKIAGIRKDRRNYFCHCAWSFNCMFSAGRFSKKKGKKKEIETFIWEWQARRTDVINLNVLRREAVSF